MLPHRRWLTVCLLCWVVTGCGSVAASPDRSHSPPATSASPSLGTAISAGDFTTVVPQGWTNTIGNAAEVQRLRSDGQVVYLVEQAPPGQVQANVNDVRANINVVVLSQKVPDDQLTSYLSSVSNNGATNLSAAQELILDGANGQYITYDRDIESTPGESRDLLVNHGSSTYHIVLNTSQFAFNQQLAGLQAILTAWKWSPA